MLYPMPVGNPCGIMWDNVGYICDNRCNMKLRLAHLYPDHMNIYGDRGNVLSLKQRCAWRGIELTIDAIGVGTTVDWDAVDLSLIHI